MAQQVVPEIINNQQIGENHNQDITLGIINNKTNGVFQNVSIHYQIQKISRQVNRLTTKSDCQTNNILNNFNRSSLKSSYKRTNFNPKQIHDININSILIKPQQQNQIGRYNYYGHKYRFEETDRHKKQKQLQKDQQLLKQKHLNEQLQEQKLNKFKITKRQLLNPPTTQSYYIYFQNPNKQSKIYNQMNNFSKKSQKQKTNNIQPTHDYQQSMIKSNNSIKHNHSKINQQKVQNHDQQKGKQQLESKWMLQKKVQKMQKQLKQLKKKQQKRQRTLQFSQVHNKKDTKIKVQKHVERLLNSLWP